jgi:hypothetical protein
MHVPMLDAGMFDDWQADIGVAVPLSYRAPDNSSRSARLLFSLSSAFKPCPARPTTRCLQTRWTYRS